ncbi:hypothetical protein A0H81_09889 [Grifola frondosa]|uniref:Uncharacterized protein n=1 Tax=Grifola frondosa TaxID=5627 RepID=A0A1C7LZG2_GRIFR|nr:hypothetical protein A0H81_09889 [Grifola frondosa]
MGQTFRRVHVRPDATRSPITELKDRRVSPRKSVINGAVNRVDLGLRNSFFLFHENNVPVYADKFLRALQRIQKHYGPWVHTKSLYHHWSIAQTILICCRNVAFY